MLCRNPPPGLEARACLTRERMGSTVCPQDHFGLSCYHCLVYTITTHGYQSLRNSVDFLPLPPTTSEQIRPGGGRGRGVLLPLWPGPSWPRPDGLLRAVLHPIEHSPGSRGGRSRAILRQDMFRFTDVETLLSSSCESNPAFSAPNGWTYPSPPT